MPCLVSQEIMFSVSCMNDAIAYVYATIETLITRCVVDFWTIIWRLASASPAGMAVSLNNLNIPLATSPLGMQGGLHVV